MTVHGLGDSNDRLFINLSEEMNLLRTGITSSPHIQYAVGLNPA